MAADTFGDRLKIARDLLDLTQDDLAKRAQLDERGGVTISEYERGKEPKVTAVAALVRALPEISTRWLLTGEGHPDGPPGLEAAQIAIEEIEAALRKMRGGGDEGAGGGTGPQGGPARPTSVPDDDDGRRSAGGEKR